MISLIHTSFPDKEIALKIGKALLEKKLIACTHITPSTSQYVWKGNYHEETEFITIFKTNSYNKREVIKYIKNEHPYEIPYIMSEDHVINNAYKVWMDSFLTQY